MGGVRVWEISEFRKCDGYGDVWVGETLMDTEILGLRDCTIWDILGFGMCRVWEMIGFEICWGLRDYANSNLP